ncbi:hypothetical protein, partial [Aeromonas caviae]|uniref:hypothetical protein n=1 Tax=Aeromonas caviae TaxID=648 RepID=UPI001CC3BBFB
KKPSSLSHAAKRIEELESKIRRLERENNALLHRFVLLHIPVENEHLFRFKMNADSGLRVHHFRTPQSTNSDV